MVRSLSKNLLLASSLVGLTTLTTPAYAKEAPLTQSLISKAERIKLTETHAKRAEEINKQSEESTNQKRADDLKRQQDDAKRQQDDEKRQQEEKHQQDQKQAQENTTQPQTVAPQTPITHDDPRFGPNGLLLMDGGGNAAQVYNLIHAIPGGMNGGGYHVQTGLDNLIDTLTTPQAFWVLYKLEGPGFGQLADGYAGFDTHDSHQALITNQLNRRFNGSIHQLLKKWGTFAYNGY